MSLGATEALTASTENLCASRLLVIWFEQLHVVVGIGSATQEEAEEDAEAAYEEKTQEDVDQRGGPEGKQVECLVAIGFHTCCVLVVVGLINRVDPHITYNGRTP